MVRGAAGVRVAVVMTGSSTSGGEDCACATGASAERALRIRKNRPGMRDSEGSFMDVCFGFRQEQTPHPEPEERLLSRFIFAMKISRATCAKTNHVERVSTQGRMFGLRISAGDLPAPSPLAFTGIDADWLSR